MAPSTKETSICFLITLSHCNYERGNGETRLTHSEEFIDELNETRTTNEFGVRTWEADFRRWICGMTIIIHLEKVVQAVE